MENERLENEHIESEDSYIKNRAINLLQNE